MLPHLYVITDARRPWRARIHTMWVLVTGTVALLASAIDALICARIGIPRLGWAIPCALRERNSAGGAIPIIDSRKEETCGNEDQ